MYEEGHSRNCANTPEEKREPEHWPDNQTTVNRETETLRKGKHTALWYVGQTEAAPHKQLTTIF